MDKLLEHIEQSILRLTTESANRTAAQMAYIESFRSDRPEVPQNYSFSFSYPRTVVLAAATWILKNDGFDLGGGADYARSIVFAGVAKDYDGKTGVLARFPRRSERLSLSFRAHISVDAGATMHLRTNRWLPTWAEDFEKRMRQMLRDTPQHILDLIPPEFSPAGALPEPKEHQQSGGKANEETDRILEPGKELRKPIRGNLLDYSGFAEAKELADLSSGDLPLGRYAWGFSDAAAHGPSLFLGKYRSGEPMIYNGALICAPQNSGKTELIMRWALAANRAGHSVFIVDVKGNLYSKIGHQLQGKVRHFSTAPPVTDCNRINFLAGLEGSTPLDGMRVRQLAQALLPHEGWEQGEQAFFYQNHVNWLSGLIQILLLHKHYLPGQCEGGEVNLGQLYELASNEQTLYRVMANIAIMEERTLRAQKEPRWPGLAYWLNEIALLVDPERGGQRSSEYTYRTLTQSIVNALRPFSRFGTLYHKTGGAGKAAAALGPFFSFEDLNDPKEPVTIILAAREQDLDDAATVVSMAVQKLQQFLFDRMNIKKPRPILLLLDETRRIRSFKANEYITFAREAKAGCVIVYQSIDQIGEPEMITEILENVGTQIYLGSLVGNTAKQFIDMLPVRYRPTYSVQSQISGEGHASTLQVGQEQISYVTSNELYRLPGGRWPALVYINDQPRRKPFLVDLDKELAERPAAA